MLEQEKIVIEDVASCIITTYNNGKANVLIVDDVFVEPEHRKKGLGTRLMEIVILTAKKKNIDCIELVVNKDSIARKLYKKVGFKKTDKEHCRLILNKF